MKLFGKKTENDLTAQQRQCLETAKSSVNELRNDGISRSLEKLVREELLSRCFWLIIQAHFRDASGIYDHAIPGIGTFLFADFFFRYGGKETERDFLNGLRKIIECKNSDIEHIEERARLTKELKDSIQKVFFYGGPVLYPQICEVLNARPI